MEKSANKESETPTVIKVNLNDFVIIDGHSRTLGLSQSTAIGN